MTERYGSGYGDEGGQRPSGRGAVTERLARQEQQANEIDLTDEARDEPARQDESGDTVASPAARPDDDLIGDRESSGAFEPAAQTADPPADATQPGSESIFDLGERAKQEDQAPTGYEPPVSDADPAEPRGATVVTEPGEARDEVGATGSGEASDESTEITPTPVPVADPAAAAPGSLLGSLDAGDIRNRFLDIQAGFVDEPRQAVEEAGRLVDDLVQQVVDALQGQRGQLADTTGEGSTEELRLALRAYRQFVDRLLGLVD